MSTMPQSAFGPSMSDERALKRMISWSIGVHLALVALVVLLPRDWFRRADEARTVMTISLGGTPGPQSTGTNSIGGRTVEQVAPPARRPEPVRATPREEPAPVPARVPSRPDTSRPIPTTRPVTPAARPPVTGPQVVQGNTRVDTGARGQGTGLTFGGGGTGGVTDLADFCCKEYLDALLGIINGNWKSNQAEARGTTTIKFTIRRDGTIDLNTIEVEKSSGSRLLDRVAHGALVESNSRLRLLPLPARYTEPALTVHLNFPYGPSQ